MRKLLLSAMALLLSSALMAGPVGKDEAQSKALAFLNGKVSTPTNGSARVQRRLQNLSLAASEKAYHVFNVDENGGFVIVSGSDLTPDIIGYADEGSFDAQNIPDNMKAWLAGYAEQIEWAEAQGVSALPGTKNMRKVGSIKSSIAPLIQTTWNQDAPYYNSCPNFFTYGKCVTGCVATAMAQVLYYLNQQDGFPTGTTNDIAGYECNAIWGELGKISVAACPKAIFEWGKMEKSYVGVDDASKKAAVAELMQYCGAAVHMQYANSANGGSQASVGNIPEALQTYFGFDRNVRFENRKNYTEAEWEDLIYNEVANGRPVIYGGMSAGGGHGFVCDGYDADGLFHVNWGWGGLNDGYYLLTALIPSKLGIGGGKTADGFTMNQQIVAGIQKPTGKAVEDGPITLILEKLDYTGLAETLKTATYLTIPFSGGLRCDLAYTHKFHLGLAFYDGGTLVKAYEIGTITSQTAKTFSPVGTINIPMMELNALLTSGKTYQLKMVNKLEGSDEWIPCTNPDDIYIQTVVTDTKMIMSTVGLTTVLNASDINLVTDGVVGTLQKVTATIGNSGTGVYRSNVYLFLGADTKPVAGKGLDLKAGGKTDVVFNFIPTAKGTTAIKITTDEAGTQVIGSGSITIKESPDMSGDDSPALTFEKLDLNVADDKFILVLDNKMTAKVPIKNETDKNYKGKVRMVLRNETMGITIEIEQEPIIIPAYSTQTLTYEYNLELNDEYTIQMKYQKDGAFVSDATKYGKYKAKAAVAYTKGDGTDGLTLLLPLEVPEEAYLVDLRGRGVEDVDVSKANPNCLYLFNDKTEVPATLTQNVVVGTETDNLVLTDDGVHGFYSPIDFTATKVTYKRKFKNGFKKGSTEAVGWSTLTVPFNVTKVTVKGTEISWFKSSEETGKNFWVYAFSSDDKDKVNFTWTSGIKANTPYIINVPVGDEWGSNNLKDKEIVFEGSGEIKANAKSTLSGSYHLFAGTNQKVDDASGFYQINAEGKKFEKGLKTKVEPFRAYFFDSSRDLFGSVLSIGIENGEEITGIAELKSAATENVKSEGWYTLTGVKLNGAPAKKGVYLHNGKKVNVR